MTLCLYYTDPPESDRWFQGDRFLRRYIRQLFRKKKISGVDKVFLNLVKGLDKLNINYKINIPFEQLKADDAVIVLGQGQHCLLGYNQPNSIIAGIGLMTHPSQWPDLCQKYPVRKYLQHSKWANNIYKSYFGDDVCVEWPAGIDTDDWKPSSLEKGFDVLLYIKIHWDKDVVYNEIVAPIKAELESRDLKYHEITYGLYKEEEYRSKLELSKSMIFLTEHESQGFACCEAMSMNVPIFAWDEGFCKDPNRFVWDDPVISTSTVPFFNEMCGEKFKNIEEFKQKIGTFLFDVERNSFSPRKYILEHLTLEKSAERMLEIVREVYG